MEGREGWLDRNRENLFLLGVLVFYIGLLLSRSLITGAATFLALLALTRPQTLTRTLRPPVIFFILLFGLLALSWFYTENYSVWLFKTRNWLSLLGLSLAFTAAPVTKRAYVIIDWLLVVSVSLVAVPTLLDYTLHQTEYNRLLAASGAVPVWGGLMHIDFGILQALAFFAALRLARHYFGAQLTTTPSLQRRTRLLWGATLGLALLLLITSLHVLASRTGLAGFYFAVFVLFIAELPRLGYRKALVLGAIGFTFFVAALLWLPSLHNKTLNTQKDLQNYVANGPLDDWSVGRRFAAWQVSLAVWQQSPLIGVGPADVQQEMDKLYALSGYNLAAKNRVNTHNQFLETLAGLGLPGLVVLLLVLFYPFRYANYRNSSSMLTTVVILVVAFCTDSPLELQVGVNLTTFSLLLAWQREHNEPGTTSAS